MKKIFYVIGILLSVQAALAAGEKCVRSRDGQKFLKAKPFQGTLVNYGFINFPSCNMDESIADAKRQCKAEFQNCQLAAQSKQNTIPVVAFKSSCYSLMIGFTEISEEECNVLGGTDDRNNFLCGASSFIPEYESSVLYDRVSSSNSREGFIPTLNFDREQCKKIEATKSETLTNGDNRWNVTD
jgi:hypothetical protein